MMSRPIDDCSASLLLHKASLIWGYAKNKPWQYYELAISTKKNDNTPLEIPW